MIPKLPIAPVMDDVISFVQHPTQLLCGAAAPSAPSTAP
jgi:hypothetical protein